MRVHAATPLLLALTAAHAQPRSTIDGYWKNPIGSAIVAIAPCGADTACGKVVWASKRGEAEASTSTSQVVGTLVLTNLRPSNGRWLGTLFIPDDNVHVSARLQLLDERRLKLTGCAFAGLFCRSQVWTRVDGPLPARD